MLFDNSAKRRGGKFEVIFAIQRVASDSAVKRFAIGKGAARGEVGARLLEAVEDASRRGDFGGRPSGEEGRPRRETRRRREENVVPKFDGSDAELKAATLAERLGSARPIIKKPVIRRRRKTQRFQRLR